MKITKEFANTKIVSCLHGMIRDSVVSMDPSLESGKNPLKDFELCKTS